MKKTFWIFLVLIAGAAALLFFTKSGLYPIASVNDSPIFQEKLELSYQAAYRYYENSIKTYGAPEENFDSARFQSDLRHTSLDSLIENELVSQGLINLIGSKKVEMEIEKRLSSATSTSQIADKVYELYGLSLNEFENLVLIPSAEREILSELLLEKGIALNAWLADERIKADVEIFLPGYQWEEGRVIANVAN